MSFHFITKRINYFYNMYINVFNKLLSLNILYKAELPL